MLGKGAVWSTRLLHIPLQEKQLPHLLQVQNQQLTNFMVCMCTLDLRCKKKGFIFLNNLAPFEITPSPLTVAVEQEVAVFVCQYLSCDGLTWLVNGTQLNRINSTNITTFSSGRIYFLSIGTLLEYSGTTVECVATFLDGSPPIFTPPVTLLIQGSNVMVLSPLLIHVLRMYMW